MHKSNLMNNLLHYMLGTPKASSTLLKKKFFFNKQRCKILQWTISRKPKFSLYKEWVGSSETTREAPYCNYPQPPLPFLVNLWKKNYIFFFKIFIDINGLLIMKMADRKSKDENIVQPLLKYNVDTKNVVKCSNKKKIFFI